MAHKFHVPCMCSAEHIVHTSSKFQPQGYIMCTLATRRHTSSMCHACAHKFQVSTTGQHDVHTGNKTAHKVAHLVVCGTTWQLIFKHTRGGMYLDIVMSMLPHRLVHVGQDAKVFTPHNMQRSAGGQWWVVTFSNWNIVSHSPSSEGGPSYCTCVNLQKKTKEQFV